MDQGIWATWYDFPEDGKNEFLSWIHEEYLPTALSRPGYLWAAHVENRWDSERKKEIRKRLTHIDELDPSLLGGGNSFLMLFGAASPEVFLDPSPENLERSWTDRECEMFGRRSGVRSCIFMEYGRVEGPEPRKGPGITPGPIIQVGTFNINHHENEMDLAAWYAQLRNPRMSRMTGCIGARNLISVAGWAKHAIFYEFVSFDAIDRYFTTPDPENPEWSNRVVGNLVHAPGSPSLGKRIWPSE